MFLSEESIPGSFASEFPAGQRANPITVGGNYIGVYYCCSCKYGPFNAQIYGGCTDCGHTFCSRCTYTYIKQSDTLSKSCIQEDPPESVIPEPRQAISSELLPTNPTCLEASLEQKIEALPALFFESASNPQQDGTFGPSSYGDDIEDGARQFLPADVLTARPAYSTADHSPEPVDGPYVWTCDMCGSGPMLVEIAPACTECGHVRSSCCTVEAT